MVYGCEYKGTYIHHSYKCAVQNDKFSKFQETSQWTLDYPPFFAYFEYFLAHFAILFDKTMLILTKEGFESANCIIFQRCTVILTDLLYIYAAKRFDNDRKMNPF